MYNPFGKQENKYSNLEVQQKLFEIEMQKDRDRQKRIKELKNKKFVDMTTEELIEIYKQF